MLELHCTKRGVYIESPTPSLVKEEAPFRNMYMISRHSIIYYIRGFFK
jgi:hypothetical protein